MTLHKLVLITALTTTVSACGTTASQYRPIVDGPEDALYVDNLAQCRTLSEKKSYTSDEVKPEAALAAGVGAVLGAIEDGTDAAIGGATVGGVLGAGTRAWDTREERKQIVIECMKQRGHTVVG